jgi:hypothetical protein
MHLTAQFRLISGCPAFFVVELLPETQIDPAFNRLPAHADTRNNQIAMEKTYGETIR